MVVGFGEPLEVGLEQRRVGFAQGFEGVAVEAQGPEARGIGGEKDIEPAVFLGQAGQLPAPDAGGAQGD